MTGDNLQFITQRDLIVYLLASSGIATLIFSFISKLFDKASRVTIMEEIKKLDYEYKTKIMEIEKEVNKMRFNYLDRFAEQKQLITDNKEISEENHSEIKQILVGIKKDLEVLQRLTKQKE